MNREIKLRLWNDDNKSFSKINFTHLRQLIDIVGGYEDYFSSNYFHDNNFVQQYTGLTDKAGTEIYEGDIVRVNEQVCAIEYRNTYFACTFADYHLGTVWFLGGSPEVIGNIHESPELLNAKPK